MLAMELKLDQGHLTPFTFVEKIPTDNTHRAAAHMYARRPERVASESHNQQIFQKLEINGLECHKN